MHMRQRIGTSWAYTGQAARCRPMQERAAPASGPRQGVAYTQEGVLPSWAAGRIQLKPRFRAGGPESPDPGTERGPPARFTIPSPHTAGSTPRPDTEPSRAWQSHPSSQRACAQRLGSAGRRRPIPRARARACATARGGPRRSRRRAPGRLRAAGAGRRQAQSSRRGSQAGSEQHAGRGLQQAAEGLQELGPDGAVDGAVVARERRAHVRRRHEGPALQRRRRRRRRRHGRRRRQCQSPLRMALEARRHGAAAAARRRRSLGRASGMGPTFCFGVGKRDVRTEGGRNVCVRWGGETFEKGKIARNVEKKRGRGKEKRGG
jgi:hypothetical protein